MTGGLSTQVKVNVKPIGAFKSGLIRQVVFERRGLKIQGPLYYNRQEKLEFGEITACILYVRTDTIYIYIARLIIEHPREWLASLADN